ncbi:hypothetical protein [Vibrio gallaecicus]|nr:hypothetical protein [Vibrio gallaecicus]MDN3616649.1 hypothetical protein [Vibrio gallaecicus]
MRKQIQCRSRNTGSLINVHLALLRIESYMRKKSKSMNALGF